MKQVRVRCRGPRMLCLLPHHLFSSFLYSWHLWNRFLLHPTHPFLSQEPDLQNPCFEGTMQYSLCEKSTDPTYLQLPSFQVWQKDMELTPKRMSFQVPISEIWRSTLSVSFIAAFPHTYRCGTVISHPDQLLFPGCRLSKLPELKPRLCLTFIRGVPIFVTE